MTPGPLHRVAPEARRFLRGRRRALAVLAGCSLAESAHTFLGGYAVARALDDGFLAGAPRTGAIWLAVAAAAALLGAPAMRGVFAGLAALVEPLRDGLVRRAVTGALDTAVARPARAARAADTAAVSRLTQQAEMARDSFAGLLLTARSFVFTALGALVGLASLAPVLLVFVLVPLLLGLAAFAATLAPMAAAQRAWLDNDEALSARAGALAAGLRDVVACGAAPQMTAETGALIAEAERLGNRLARWAALRTLALGLAGRLPVVLLLAAAPWLLRRGVSAGTLAGALTYLLQALLPALHSLMAALGTAGTRLLVVLERFTTPPPGRAPTEPPPPHAPAPPKTPAPGVPAPGVPAPGVPAPGVPAPGVPVPGVPALGLPAPGVPVPGVPVPGVPALGLPAPGVPAPGVPALGLPAPGVPVPGVPVPGVPVPGVPALGVPARGVPAPGVPVPGVPAPGVPAPGVPAPGVPAPGVPAPGVPAPGVPAPAAPAPGAPAPTAPAAELRSVTFAYGPRARPVLRELDLIVAPGEHLAVVGPSGIGKSTLTALLAGQVQPDRGAVLLAGRPARPEPAAPGPPGPDPRRTLLPQEAYVFTGTVRENLNHLRPAPAADHRLVEAVAALGAEGLVERLGGLDGPVDPARLSQGERQHLALAAAYVSPAPLLLLDEATCHLDPRAEERAERALAARPGTLVVVAHRISSALRADRVLVLDGDSHAVCGTHEEVRERSPAYRDLAGLWVDHEG
ncbi:ABC transporter ATP-binding protein [Streptomyces sp. NPDC002054]|uniref:ABC transporter ATP-binding protein n=1 Tax=Streptomyces sp. NPDC002054 TaxID=3154663 RepID=UPI0033237D54